MRSYPFLFRYVPKLHSSLNFILLGMEINLSISGWNSKRDENFSRVRKVIFAPGKADLMVLRGEVAKTMSPIELNLITSMFWLNFMAI